jgi:uridine kinase
VTSRFGSVDGSAADVVAAVLAQPPRLGRTRLVCVDGPAGSGKTTLAAALDRGFRDVLRRPGDPALATHVRTLHMDNVYDGWDGLAAGMATMARDVVDPLRVGRAGRYRRYDWHRGEYAEARVVEPVDVLVVEGVGSGARAYADVTSCLIWVEAPPELRRERGLARDGQHVVDNWLAWQRQEQQMFASERPWERADVLVDGTTGILRHPHPPPPPSPDPS